MGRILLALKMFKVILRQGANRIPFLPVLKTIMYWEEKKLLIYLANNPVKLINIEEAFHTLSPQYICLSMFKISFYLAKKLPYICKAYSLHILNTSLMLSCHYFFLSCFMFYVVLTYSFQASLLSFTI